MRNDDPMLGPAASSSGRSLPTAPSGCSPPQNLKRRVLAWALHGPPWTYVLLAIVGLAAALLMAALRA